MLKYMETKQKLQDKRLQFKLSEVVCNIAQTKIPSWRSCFEHCVLCNDADDEEVDVPSHGHSQLQGASAAIERSYVGRRD